LKNEVGQQRLPFTESRITQQIMDYPYTKIHGKLKISCHKRRAKRAAKLRHLREYIEPLLSAIYEHDDERLAFYILEAAAWLEEQEQKRAPI